MTEEIKPNGVYTTKETQEILKVSESTFKRLLKKGFIRAAKIGHQHRILGKEILRLVAPSTEEPASRLYQRLKNKTKEIVKNW
jgi:excisionase family DNA binding protein